MTSTMIEPRPADAEAPQTKGAAEFGWSGFFRRCIIQPRVYFHARRGILTRKNQKPRQNIMSRRNSCPKLHFWPLCRQSSCWVRARSTSAKLRWSRSQPRFTSSRFRANPNTKHHAGQAVGPVPQPRSGAKPIWCRLDAVAFCLLPVLQNLWSSPCACATLSRKRRGCSCVASMPEGQPLAHTFADSDNRRYVCPNLPFLQLSAQSSHWAHVRNINLRPNRYLHPSWWSRFRPKADPVIAGQAQPAPACAVACGTGLQPFGGRPC